jgi:hypothetical protein
MVRVVPAADIIADAKKYRVELRDNLVGGGKQQRRHVEAPRPGGLQVDDCNTRFRAACYGPSQAGLAPADCASFGWRLLSFDDLVRDSKD